MKFPEDVYANGTVLLKKYIKYQETDIWRLFSIETMNLYCNTKYLHLYGTIKKNFNNKERKFTAEINLNMKVVKLSP